LIDQTTPFCFGDTPGLADLCLIPQLYNAHRWGCDLTPFSRLREIEERCLALPAFDHARPENQPDAK
jgi:glutathione S-transferase